MNKPTKTEIKATKLVAFICFTNDMFPDTECRFQ